MAKLSDAQINALKFYANGEGAAPQKRTRDSLIKNGFLSDDNMVTDEGYKAAGITALADDIAEASATTVDEIMDLLEPVPAWERELTRLIVNELPAGWHNPKHLPGNLIAWQGITLDEIRKDIRTAVPVGREGMRQMRRHANHDH